MSYHENELWESLFNKGLVVGSSPEKTELDSPWYVKALLAFSGWLAALFLLGFLAVVFQSLLDNSLACFIVGGLMIGAAFHLLNTLKSEFIEHLGLAASLAGQALVVIAVFKIAEPSEVKSWILIAALQIFLALIMPNFVHRVFSSFFSALSFSIALTLMGVPYLFGGILMLISAWIWLNEFDYPQQHKMLKAIGYGLVLSLIQLKGSVLFFDGGMTWLSDAISTKSWLKPWTGDALECGVMLYVVWQLLKKYKVPAFEPIAIMALLSSAVLCIASLEAGGITVGMMIILLGFVGSNRVLLGLGIVSLLFYISSYYYLLDATLIEKSQTLVVIGIVLLLMRWLLVLGSAWKKESQDA